MKKVIGLATSILWTTFILVTPLMSQDLTVTQSSEAADGLDLKAVGEIFRESADAEEFEKKLNDPEIGINNIDLDDNGQVDYIRVTDHAEGKTHVLVLQVQLSKTEFQDVASIEVEEEKSGQYNVQVHGNEQIYGPGYYVRPVGVTWATVAFVGWLYRPHYRPYVSPFYYGYYPRSWRPWRPVGVSVYRTRTVRVTKVRYNVHRTSTVVSAARVYKTPRSTHLVRKPLRNPTASQKKFQTRSVTKTTGAGGFGKTVRTKGVTDGERKAGSRTTTKVATDGDKTVVTRTKERGPTNGKAAVGQKKTTHVVKDGDQTRVSRSKTTASRDGDRKAVSHTKTRGASNGKARAKSKTKTRAATNGKTTVKSKSKTKTKKTKNKKTGKKLTPPHRWLCSNHINQDPEPLKLVPGFSLGEKSDGLMAQGLRGFR